MDKTLKNLNESLKNDKRSSNENFSSYSKLKEEIIKNIKENEKNLEEQKLEAIAKIEEHKNKNITGLVSIIISYLSLGIAFTSSFYKGKAIGIIIFAIIIAIVTIYVLISNTVGEQVRAYKECSYYTIKLYCIEEIEKDRKKKIKQKSIIQNKKQHSLKCKVKTHANR